MLPPMNDEYDETPDLTTDDLDDQAVNLLFDIVRRAQTSPDPSERRALFTAYEEVLAEHGVGPEDDSVLHKFLRRLQRDGRAGEGLQRRFQRVLGEMEIVVDFNEDGESAEATTDLGNATRPGRAEGNGTGRERSGSFDSFFDGSADKIAGTTDVPQDVPLRERRGSLGVPQNGDTDRWKKRRSVSDTEARSYAQAQRPLRPRVNGYGDRRAASEQHRPSHRRGRSVSSRGSLRIRRDEPTASSQFHFGDYDADGSEHTAPTANITDKINLSNVQIPGVNAPIPPPRDQVQSYVPEPFRPSDTRLMDDAETFEQQRLHSLARACLQRWRERLRERNERDEEMNRMAIAFDRRRLVGAALGDLKVEAQNRHNNKETERFFARLERRAEKARGLFLLTKAFTHWARSAEDEVQRTSVARRHILRTKFFNGWREITVVNELKIQHFVLGKFLEKWRRRAAEIRARHEVAMQIYDDNVLRKYYKDWFFKFCNIAAPAWHNVRLKRVTFEKWREIAAIMRDREGWAMDRREREVARKTLSIWRQRTAATQALQPQADDFRRRTMLKMALLSLQKQAQLAPLLAQFGVKADTRLVRSAFQNWQRSAQLSRQARGVDQLRILRNAWTTWNDRLRIKALEERINDRVLVETMYIWTLASRVSLFQRVHDRNLKESVFLTWVTKTNERRNTLDSAERRFAQFKRTQRLRFCLRKIESATAEKRAEEFAITAEYEQKLKQRVFDKLLDKHEHFQQLNTWAGDARFYVLANSTLKKWNETTQHARRNRRREMYAQVRRTVKLNLVKRAFGVWKERADHVQAQAQQAEQTQRNRTLDNSRILLSHWNERTSTLRELDQQATQRYNTHLLARSLNVWTQRMQSLQAMDTQAFALRQESIEVAATSALKRLGWKLWNVQRREENAIALHQRTFEKHVRAMLRFWYEQTVERSARRPVSPSPTGRSRGAGDDGDGDGDGHDDAGDETRRLETWTAFDEGALGLSNLDLSLSISPHHDTSPPPPPPSQSSTRPSAPSLRRPQTFPQPQPHPPSALRPRPPPIPEDMDMAFDDPNAFWTSTPMPTLSQPGNAPSERRDGSFLGPTTTGKPGYLKTPSKRSVVRGRRAEGLVRAAGAGSPERRMVAVGVELDRGMGVMSAPPGGGLRDVGGLGSGRVGGVTSFERRLRLGGFAGGTTGGSGRAKGRVGFGDVSHVG
ncbi:Sfi1-domain-containing protein [Lentithecium fluviatile CBS 122367]|uniref:Sfi1-domain-containing protein n=1 Tax=Lentithecium fluviatile CBS 122367 TaxID=1168545 RepID=A0A6G1J6M7_9PLEO|nr:Sfi1-domain-containing protein [Lentithecium fluviatile CBS 122367]